MSVVLLKNARLQRAANVMLRMHEAAGNMQHLHLQHNREPCLSLDTCTGRGQSVQADQRSGANLHDQMLIVFTITPESQPSGCQTQFISAQQDRD